ncbi:MAG: hypothetical protein A3J83_02130 [Elusimicrobia bacterium RIFOXYA2_FULL_40_6]|nr:MAG: hypothetical protein A3J83_02130 [Elusimicrobia bacterium RIFOXYA2_FULL_40_6]
MKFLKVFAGILISVFFLFLAVRNVNFNDAMQVIRSIRWGFLVFIVFVNIFGLVVRSIRWKIIVNQDIPVKKFFQATCVGQFTNNVLPFRMGDLAQGYFLGIKANLSKSVAFSTVVLERLLDIMPPMLIIVLGSFFVLMPSQISFSRIFLIVGLIVLLMFIIVKFQKVIPGFFRKCLPENKISNKFCTFLEQFFLAFGFVKDRKRAVPIIALTLLLWLTYSFPVYLCFKAFNLSLGYLPAFIVLAVTAISVAIPSSPGYVGTWEFFGTLALGIFGIDKTVGLSFALIYHIVGFLPVTIIGFFVLLHSGISISKLEKQ